MRIISIEKSAIDRFCSEWPCHGFPENLDLIVAAFDADGDLVELELCDKNDELIDGTSYEGSGAMPALLDDAKAKATVTHIPGAIAPLESYC